MNRLTKENYREDLFELQATKKIKVDEYIKIGYYSQVNYNDDLWNKVKAIEDIGEKLGIDLIILLTALTQGYVFWKYDNFIYKVEVESITNCCLKVNTWFYANSNKNGKRYGDEFSISFKDYGKTWVLTKGELKNE